MFIRRDRRGPDRWIELKAVLFTVGAVLAIVGMASGRAWLVWLAFAPLAIAFALRFAARRQDGDSVE